ncbi:autophagy-related protein 2 homolog B-like isoform X2 [Myxocyprinus asiaticus]|uniref:autophagy-related protein 2 homolog B-like isoform X2 n=1 Tax=Myxocyprinus asiaticus TaxID=70543 RepID=UPI00222302B8|nr:autophagy-related protein 2 homolog B-like isoform X2 [Myxocyprinus asiaticus]
MPWPFSESIKKRACRYLLHRYLGNFLQEKLSLDQLSLDLYQGTGLLAQVPLDKWSLNEILESVDAPFEVSEGFIQAISLTVPWASLLQDNCVLEVRGLQMVLRPRPRMASGMEPMYWSSFMTSSMQLAKECLSQRLTDDHGESSQPLEGLEKFAETIETVLRRVKVTFVDTVLRIEHVPENSKTGIALELRINKMVYCDESVEEGSSVNIHQPTTFAHKNLTLDGASVFWDEYSESARAGLKSSPTQTEMEPKLSPSWNPKIICEPHPQFPEPVSSCTRFEPVQVGCLSGKLELSMVLKQNEAMPRAKLDIDGQFDSLIMLLSPRQVHLLLDMFGVFSSSGQEWSALGKDRKSRPMQQEDEYRLHMELNRCLKKDTITGVTDQDLFESQTTRTVSSREDVFFSMADMDMSHSLSSLPPLWDPPAVDLDLSLNSNYSASLGESPSGNMVWDEYTDVTRQKEKQTNETPQLSRDPHFPQKLIRQTSHPSKGHCDESRPELVLRVTVGSLCLSVLHIDPLPPPDSSLSPLAPMASEFFRIMSLNKLPLGVFLQSRTVFDEACPHDHLRLIGQGLKVTYEHCQGSSVRLLNTDLSLSQVELLECLYCTDSHTTQNGAQYTELLTFDVPASSDSSPPTCLHLLYKLTERRGPQGGQVRLSTIPCKAELQVELGKVRSECDVSIVDRLNSLLQPQKLVTTEMMASHMYTSYNKHVSLHKAFAEVFLDDSRTPVHCHVSVSINAPLLVLVVRFPIPDLRSDQERGPWFKKSLQKELLCLKLEDLELKTEFTGGNSSEQTKIELTFKELSGSFQEDKEHSAARFFRVANTMEEDMTSSDCDKFDWPRVILKVNPMTVHSILERITTEEEEEGVDRHSQEEEEEEEGAAHSLKDVCDFGKPSPSPFSSRRVMYENEEMVIPGDVLEMTEFQEKTISNSRYILELFFPNVQLSLPNKAFYEKLHNRINNDLLLWEPTAPSPVETVENIPYGMGLSVASQLINNYSKEGFSQFRSTGPEEEESGSEEEILQYYTPAELGYRNRRKKRSKIQPKNSQSLFSIVLSVNHGLLAVNTQLKQDDQSVLQNKHGEFWMEVKNGTLFGVMQHEGYNDQHYICFHTSQACLYHHGTVDGDPPEWSIDLPCRMRPHWLEPVMYVSESAPERASPSEGLSLEPHSMLSVAVKIFPHNTERSVKEFLVAIGMRGVTLQHKVVPSNLGWYDQIVDFLNVSDEPVLGYTPLSSVSTLHLHLWSCSLDYRPLYLPVRSLLTVENFSISRSVSLDHSSSTLRIILDEAALFLSDKINAVSVNLARDYVQVVDMGTLELRITAVKPGTDGKMTEPRFELRCSSDVIHIRTCSDSCAALMNLIQYIASYGDLIPPSGLEHKSRSTKQIVKTEAVSRPPANTPLLPEEEQQILQDLMCDAMEDTDGLQSHTLQQNGVSEDHSHNHDPPHSDLFLFPDESGNLGQEPSPTYPTLHSPLISPPVPSLPHDSDDFCILDTPGSRERERDEEPMVKKLTSEPVVVKEDHFSVPLQGCSSNRGPLHFPVPEVRYLVKEISVVWHLYGGKDFGGGALSSSPARSRGCTPHSSPSQTSLRQARKGSRAGGWGRNPDVLMEIHLSKVRFQHEVYPQMAPEAGDLLEQPVSRQVFSVQDLEIRDRLASSMMNKFLYLYSSKEMPRKAHSNMLTIRALHVSPEAGQAPQECCLRVSLMPLRLNIDQDAMFFLKNFFSSLAAEVELFSPPEQEVFCVSMKKPTGPEVSCSFSKYNGGASQDPAPIISVPIQARSSTCGQDSTTDTDQPIFFREFRFTSEVPIRLDYHGKHMAMEQGTFAGIVIGLTQLNCSELKLRRLCYRQGLLGVDKLFSYAINEWLNDIKKNQLPGLLGGVGPIHSLVQLVQGFRDFLWLPIEQYRKDGRIVRGFQRGTAFFGTSTAMAALELTNRMVRTIQAAAETAYDMVSPVPDEKECKKIKRYSHYCLAHQPVDLREGVAKAYSVVKEGITDTALIIYDTATREHEQRGMTGAVGGVLRQLPPTVVKPLIVATEATSNVLGGMRNQIHPDARQEESQKWRFGEE